MSRVIVFGVFPAYAAANLVVSVRSSCGATDRPAAIRSSATSRLRELAELLAPAAVEVDENGATRALRLACPRIGDDARPRPTGQEKVLPARAVLVAIGTRPNATLAREHPGFAEMDGKYYRAVDEDGDTIDTLVQSRRNRRAESVKLTVPYGGLADGPLDVFAKYVVHPEHSEQNGVATHAFQTEEAPDEDSS